jgi:hypothetical protein
LPGSKPKSALQSGNQGQRPVSGDASTAIHLRDTLYLQFSDAKKGPEINA